jgi:hypothetical protein
MAANTITRTRLRRLADVKPERGRVLSVFLNLDPTEFATPAARSTAVTSVMTEAAHRVDQADGLDHAERVALKADIDRVRETLMASDIAQNGARAVAVYAASRRTCSRSCGSTIRSTSPSCSTARPTSSRSSPRPARSSGACCW